MDDVKRKFHEGTAPGTKARTAGREAPDGGEPEEHVTAADRQALRHLIRRVDR